MKSDKQDKKRKKVGTPGHWNLKLEVVRVHSSVIIVESRKHNCHKLALDQKENEKLDVKTKKQERHNVNKVTLEQGSSANNAIKVSFFRVNCKEQLDR